MKQMAEEKKISKRGIKRKIAVFLSSSILIVVVIGIALGYFWGFSLLHATVREEYYRIANTLAYSISTMMEEKIDDIRLYLSSSLLQNAVIEENLKYETMEGEAAKQYLMDSNKTWIDASEDSPIVREYTVKASGVRLKELEKFDKAIGEIFLTDRLGGLVAVSRKTTDFYHADERWWQEAYNKGAGGIFIGDIEFDKSSNVWSITFAVPIIDEGGKIIGVCKAVIDISTFFKSLENFKIGNTGHAVLINKKGDIIFHRGIAPMSMKFANEEDLQKIFKTGWGVIKQSHLHKEAMFVTFAKIEHPVLARMGMIWRVFIDQPVTEVFAPLNALVMQAALLTGILFLIIIPVGFIFGGLFVKPIITLRHAAENIGKGDLDYRIELKTDDEIEELADSFNKMTEDLKRTTTTIDALNKEIAERQKAEEEVKMKQQQMEFILGATKTGLDIIDSNFNMIYIDPEWKKIYGDFPGKKCYEYFAGRKDMCPTCAIPKALETKKPVVSEEVLPKERNRSIQVITIPFQNKKGEWLVVEINVDIEERKKVEETLKKAYKELSETHRQLVQTEKLAAIGQLATSIAHGINNPLSVISGEAQMLLADSKKDKETKEASKTIIDQAKRVKLITEGLLEFARKRELETELLDVNGILEKALSLLIYQAKLEGIKIIKELKPALPKIYGNENQIQEAFLCIMLNAIQAMEKGGSLTIRSRSEKIEKNGRRKTDVFKQGQNVVVIEFEDTGEGMSEELIKRLFEPFFTTREKGTGLGLAITYKIIEAHKGTIEVRSKLGEGSTFVAKLPVGGGER